MYYPGLKGITAVETALSEINGEKGNLFYRGVPVEKLIEKHSFEEVVYFLLSGKKLDENGIHVLNDRMKEARAINENTKNVLDQFIHQQSLIASIRSAISCLDESRDHWPINEMEVVDVIAKLPTIIAYLYRRKRGLEPVEPKHHLSHAANFLYMLFGEEKTEKEAAALEAYMILTAEHGLNASTFAARVVASTQSDIYSAITAGIGALKGPLHGGAPSGVLTYIEEVQGSTVEEVVKNKIVQNEKIMGFGHRIYQVKDPRAKALQQLILKMDPIPDWAEFLLDVEQQTETWLNQLKPGRNLYANVEYYAAAIMKAIEIPAELFTPIFCSSRIVGWSAHIMEQSRNNVIFRPQAKYIGS
ncbi:citrate synthase/methylcitrate synthase [Halobacillus salinarum]|uniref:Citrate synthase n=1 Tax=Halobacillus salinarum TaxID=2932257 RepID=A0ABY4EFT7_9BACI|nr:citrate/2-methylcitrate synthase [Halobacillus salinarum]UOQ42928.1 citrate synthase/methylcitrate synthase [Halobacillus salinarum]